MIKKVLSIMLVAVLILGIVPMHASAAVNDTVMEEIEPNNSIALADRIYNDYTVQGTITQDDEDYYKFVLPESSDIMVVCAAQYGTLVVVLCDANGDAICLGLEDDTSYSAPADVIIETLSAGTYYLYFVNYEDGWYDNYYRFYFAAVAVGSHTHSFTSVVTPSTCKSEGYTTYTCPCGYSYKADYTPAHNFGDWEIVVASRNCQHEGEKNRRCADCGFTEIESFYAEHKYDSNWDVICNLCGHERPILNGWVFENGKWAFYTNNIKVTNCWMEDSKGWCYIGADGYMLTDAWVMDSVGWCYVGADGYCVTNSWVADSVGWCYLDENGRMVTNRWIMDSVGWCYVGDDGYCVTNCWVADSVGWCYLDENGRMVTDEWVMDSVGWCYVGDDGYCVTNCWMQDSYGWFYLDENGRLATNRWVMDSVGWCYLDEYGYMVTDCWVRDSQGWCYVGADGYYTEHPLDYHEHVFSEATFFEPATCSCGAINGATAQLSIMVNGEEPFYSMWLECTEIEITNLAYSIGSDNILTIYFDAEKTYDKDGNSATNNIAASFELYDSEDNLVDLALFEKSDCCVGDKLYDEEVEFDLSNWSGKGELTLKIYDIV